MIKAEFKRSVSVSEVWKPVVGYEGLYEVSNWGRIKSLEKVIPEKGWMKNYVQAEKVLKATAEGSGYLKVILTKDGMRSQPKIHRLVADAFILNLENKPFVNHLNGDKHDNRLENLEWVTHSENMRHAYDSGLRRDQKQIEQYDANDNYMKTYRSISEAGRVTGIKRANISSVLTGKRKTAGGYMWRYAQ